MKRRKDEKKKKKEKKSEYLFDLDICIYLKKIENVTMCVVQYMCKEERSKVKEKTRRRRRRNQSINLEICIYLLFLKVREI